MSKSRDQARTKAALWYLAGAILTTGLAVAGDYQANQAASPNRITGLVLPGFAEQGPKVAKFMITTAEGTYSLVKQGEAWVLPERGGYPVRAEVMNQLGKALSTLSYRAARTSDPAQHGRLGVGDPAQGGDGALLNIYAGAGPALASLYVGVRGDSLYVRKPGADQVFLAEADMPPLRVPAQWLDFAVIEVLPEQIATLSVKPADEPAFEVVRRPDGGLGPVGGVPNVNATTIALALTKWRPVDVRPAPELTSPPVFEHTTTLRTGIAITAAGHEKDNRGWIVLKASPTRPDGAALANEINTRAKDWAFGLSATDFADYTLPRDAVLNGPESLSPKAE